MSKPLSLIAETLVINNKNAELSEKKTKASELVEREGKDPFKLLKKDAESLELFRSLISSNARIQLDTLEFESQIEIVSAFAKNWK